MFGDKSIGCLFMIDFQCETSAVADLGFPRGGGTNSRGGGRQHTILPNFPKNCMKLKEFGSPGGPRIQNFTM